MLIFFKIFRPENIYHVTVMPCYDKKLEAAREDFVFSVDHNGSDLVLAEVDSVLTSREILDLILVIYHFLDISPVNSS